MPAVKKILVLSLTRMGDIVQSIPFFRRLRIKHTEAEIHVLVEECFKEVAGFLPCVDKIHTVRMEDLLPALATDQSGNLSRGLVFYRGFIESFKSEHYDDVWNLTHTRPATVVNFLLAGENGKGVTLDENGFQKVNAPWLKYFFATNLARPWCQFNLVDIYANCVDGIDPRAGRSLNIQVDRTFDDNFNLKDIDSSKKTVALHMGASQKAKQWPLERFLHVAESLLQSSNYNIVLIGSAKDSKLGDRFNSLPGVSNLIGKTSPRELAAVLRDCDLIITNDSGPMHIAAAVGTKVIAITVGSALGSETAPYGEGHLVLEPDMECFPCSPNNPCPVSTCAMHIKPEVVTDLTHWILHQSAPGPQPRNLQGSRVYMTSRSPVDGMLTLKRLFSSHANERDTLHEIIRPAWLQVLTGMDKGNVHEGSFNLQLAEDAAGAGRIVKDLLKQTECLIQFAQNKTISKSDILKTGKQIEDLDKRLSSYLGRQGILNSFLSFASISKASLSGSTLLEQAQETHKLYSQLEILINALTSERKKSLHTENKTKKYIAEVNHENYAQWS